MAEVVSHFRPVRIIQKGFCLATIENLMKYWPLGSYLVLKITPIVACGRPLITIGYKYYSRKVLRFISTE